MDVVAPPEETRLAIHAGRLRKLQHHPTYAKPDSSTSTPSPIKRRALNEVHPNTAGNKRKKTHEYTGTRRTGRPKKTATGARAVNTTREHVVNTPGETVVLGRLLNRLFEGSEYYSQLAGYTGIQRDKTLVNPGIQVVLSQRDPLPCPAFKEVPEGTTPEPASEYAAVTRRQHSRQERTIEDCAEDRPTRRRGPYRQLE